MAGRSQKRLTKDDVDALLKRLEHQMPRQECWSCECLQGFLAQLELDAADDAGPLLTKHRITPKKIHPCLGCEPCPPAEIFAEYLMRRRGE